MESDANYWRELGRRLGVTVVAPVEIELFGSKATFTALLPDFGAPCGMVVDADWGMIEPHESALLAAGYGFSCVSAGNVAYFDDPEAIESVCEMLADWSWSSASPKPNWLRP
jgi:hypothetical protein